MSDALAEIKRLVELERVLYTQHARERMVERGATARDVRCALRSAKLAKWQADRENWRVGGGVDLDGDELTVVVDLLADVIVVTLF